MESVAEIIDETLGIHSNPKQVEKIPSVRSEVPQEVHHESITEEEVIDQIDDLCASKQESLIEEEPIVEESVRTTSS